MAVIPDYVSEAYTNYMRTVKPLRVLVTGPSKVGKTTWLLDAVKSGYTVILADGDNSEEPIRKLAPELQKQIIYMNCHDDLTTYRFQRIIRNMCEKAVFMWDLTAQTELGPMSIPNSEHVYMELRLAEINSNVILGIDSWTKLAASLLGQVANEFNFNLMDVAKIELNYFNPLTIKANTILNYLSCLPCHVVATAHPTEYVKMKKKEGPVKDNSRMADQEVEYVKMVPNSISKPHGMLLTPHFPDAPWMDVDAKGGRYFDARVLDSREGGAWWGDRVKLDDSRSFAALARAHGCPEPDPDAELQGIRFYAPGELQRGATKKAGTQAFVKSAAPKPSPLEAQKGNGPMTLSSLALSPKQQ